MSSQHNMRLVIAQMKQHKKIVDAAAKGCDTILLDLHGAMVTEAFDDGEGELLRRLRQVAPKTPIGVALDMHTWTCTRRGFSSRRRSAT